MRAFWFKISGDSQLVLQNESLPLSRFFFALNIQAFSLFQLYLDPGYGTAVGISSLAQTAQAARDDPVDVNIK